MSFKFNHVTYPDNAVHVILDLETTSLEPTAGILQIGAVTLAKVDIPKFTCHISVADNERAKRHIDPDTLEWWNKQDPDLRKRVFGGSYTLKDSLEMFVGWCKYAARDDLSRVVLWSKPQCFDLPILKSAVELYQTWPFSHRNVGCCYTAMRALPLDVQTHIHNEVTDMYPALEAHDALHDAIYQAVFVKGFLQCTS